MQKLLQTQLSIGRPADLDASLKKNGQDDQSREGSDKTGKLFPDRHSPYGSTIDTRSLQM